MKQISKLLSTASVTSRNKQKTTTVLAKSTSTVEEFDFLENATEKTHCSHLENVQEQCSTFI